VNPLSKQRAVNDIDTPAKPPEPSPHPLALALIESLAAHPAPRIVLLGYGSGRNAPPLLQRQEATITIVEADTARRTTAAERFAGNARVSVYASIAESHGAYDAVLSTHALLHGTPATVRATIEALTHHLTPNAPLHITLGSKRDPRFGTGQKIAPDSYAPETGSETGVPHAYFDEPGIRNLLHSFTIEALEEASATESAGTWAHTESESATLRHWFIKARLGRGAA
jgi:hypothetical protein